MFGVSYSIFSARSTDDEPLSSVGRPKILAGAAWGSKGVLLDFSSNWPD